MAIAAAGGQERLPLVLKDDRRRGETYLRTRSVMALLRQGLGGEGDNLAPQPALTFRCGIERSRPIERRAGRSGDRRWPTVDLLRLQVERPDPIRRAPTSTNRRCICDLIDDDQPLRIGSRREKRCRRLVLRSVREVQAVEFPIPGQGMD